MGAIRLGGIQVDPARNVIANGASSWSIEPKIMDLLVLLASRPEEVLSREFLIDHVWKVEFGADESLTRAVSLLRKTFREAGYAGEVIETIPKRGYRLVVKPEADLAPVSPGPVPASAPSKPIRTPEPPKPVVANPAVAVESRSEKGAAGYKRYLPVAGIVAAAVIAIAVIAIFVMRPQAGATQAGHASQLIAFFGFTPVNNDAAAKSTAEAATDAMFETMRSNWFDTVARTETRGVEEGRRFERASELGARYIMGGDVRSTANGVTLSIRFEDVGSHLTLWEGSIASPAPDVAYLPAQAVWQTASVVWCIIKTREALTHDTTELLSLIADRCREGGVIDSKNASYVVSRMRAIVEADPNSAYNQAQLVNLLGLGIPYAPAPAKATWTAEAEAALQRAIDLDPNETNIQFARLNLATGKNIPAAEFDALALEAQAKSEARDNFALALANGYHAALLASAGRFAEALPHAVARSANRAIVTPGNLGMAQAQDGRVAEARTDLDPTLAAYGPQVWDMFVPFALFLNAPDPDVLLKSPPSTVPKPTVDCLRDIRAALVSSDARVRSAGVKKVRECSASGVISWRVTLPALAALGDLDGAFAEADKLSFSIAATRSYETASLFYPQTRAMRADPRFLPLVEKMGMMDYWRATKSQPDVCAREAAPLCAVLKAANAKP